MNRLSAVGLIALLAIAAGACIVQPSPMAAGKAGSMPQSNQIIHQPAQPIPLQEALDKRMATLAFQKRASLKDALNDLQQFLKQNEKMDFPILIDDMAFKEANPDAPDVYDTQVMLPGFPATMTVEKILQMLLSNVATRDATYVILPDYVLITTYERCTAERKLTEKIRGVFDKRPLASVLKQLSEKVGATVIIDNRVGDKAKTEITAAFLNDIDLAGALRVVTEMAELKVIVLDGAIFVTTPTHAEALRKEHQDKAKKTELTNPLFGPGGNNAQLPGGPGLPGFPGQPGIGGPPDPASNVLDPLWPYLPRTYGPRIGQQ